MTEADKSFAAIFMRAYAKSSASPASALSVLKLAEFHDWWAQFARMRGRHMEPPPRLGRAKWALHSSVPAEVFSPPYKPSQE